MITNDIQNNISFGVKLGPKINKTLRKEFNNNLARITKFERIFEDTFDKVLDSNIVVDIDKKQNLIFSHIDFPDVKYSEKNTSNKDILKKLFILCPRDILKSERHLFRLIISKALKSGVNFEELAKMADKISLPTKQGVFMTEALVAKRIKKEKPDSEFRLSDFEYMSNKIADEDLKNPNSELYKLKESFFQTK